MRNQTAQKFQKTIQYQKISALHKILLTLRSFKIYFSFREADRFQEYGFYYVLLENVPF